MTLRTRTGSSPIRASLFREALHFGGWVTIGSLAFVAFQRLDVFLLTALHPGPEVGTYGVATRFAAMAAVFGSTITAVLMPMGSNQSTWSARESRRSYVIESVLSVGLTVTAITLGILATPMLVGSLFGSEYAAAVEPARVLLLAQIVLIAQMPFYFGFYALKGERWIAGLGVSQVIVSALAGYWLIGKHGIAGAAWSNVITYAIGLAVVTVFHITRMSRSTLRAWT
jgi:O-antigen/teichoic acid export membrane protein